MQQAVERNGSTCDVCHRKVVPDSSDYRAAYLIKRTIMCVYCRSASRHESIPTAPLSGIREETVVEICNAVLEKCREEDLPPPLPLQWPRYVTVPQDKIALVVDTLIKAARRVAGAMSTSKRSQPSHKTTAHKKEFGKGQHDKCAYCSTQMHYKSAIDMNTMAPERRLTLATWEHLTNLGDGGNWDHRNLILACWFCNNLRNEMKLSHDEFAVWLYGNRAEFDRLREQMAKRMAHLSKTKFSRDKVVNESVGDFSGWWLDASGDFHDCDHLDDVHHADVALELLNIDWDYDDDDFHDEEEEEDFRRGFAIDAALDDGWVRCCVYHGSDGLQAAIQWKSEITVPTASTLMKWVREYAPMFSEIQFEAPGMKNIRVGDVRKAASVLKGLL